MKEVRIGNDIAVEWSLERDGQPFELSGLRLSLYLKGVMGKVRIEDYSVSGNTIYWRFRGKEQRMTGIYSLVLVCNEAEDGMITTDVCDFVKLVECSCKAVGADGKGVHTETISLTSQVVTGVASVVDSVLSETSSNPVENRVVTAALAGKVDRQEGKGLSSNDYTDADKEKLAGLGNYDDTAVKQQIGLVEKKADSALKQVADVESELTELSEEIVGINSAFGIKDFSEKNKGFYKSGDVIQIVEDERYMISDYMSVNSGDTLIYEGATSSSYAMMGVVYYDANKNYLPNISLAFGNLISNEANKITIPNGVSFVRFSASQAGDFVGVYKYTRFDELRQSTNTAIQELENDVKAVADAQKEVQNQIEGISEEIGLTKDAIESCIDVTESINLANPAKYTDGYIMTKFGTPSAASSSFYMEKMAVQSGERIYMTLPRSITAYNADGAAVSSQFWEPNIDAWNESSYYEVPNGISYIVITGYKSRLPYMVNKGDTLLPYQEYKVGYEIRESVLPVLPATKIEGLTQTDTIKDASVYDGQLLDGYVTMGGSVGGQGSFVHTEPISVKEGDVLIAVGSQVPLMRFLAAYDKDGNPTSKGSPDQIRLYQVPSGVVSVVVSWDIRNGQGDGFHLFILSDQSITKSNYIERDELSPIEVVKSGRLFNMPQASLLNITSSNSFKNSVCAAVRKDIVFRGKISSFSDLSLGLMHNGIKERYVKVDTTKLYIYNQSSVEAAYEHGLSISEFIAITLVIDGYKANVYVQSLGGFYSVEFNGWTSSNCELFASTESSYLMNCYINFIPKGIDKRVWLFGDSYMSKTSDRVGYWLDKFGADYMLNATPGETSMRGLLDFYYLIQFATPAVVVWMMGMNDSDSDVVSDRWLGAYNVVKSICDKKGIELVLYAVPSVPNIPHTYKNAIVRNSGYRYIDGENAVGANASGTWYNGMLSNDAVHPSEKGAIALAQEVLMKVPELI